MYYFELFGIPVSLNVNKADVLKKYYQLSKEFHPDQHSMSSSSTQEKSLDMSAVINDAKKILDNPYKRLEYILKESDTIVEDEKYTLSPQFLGDMMDLNEQLMELEFEPNEHTLTAIKNELALKEQHLYEQVKSFFESNELNLDQSELALLKDFYYKRKYLQRIAIKLN